MKAHAKIYTSFPTRKQHMYVKSVVPRARHCGIPAILPSMSLKIAPSAGLRARPKNPADFHYLKPVFVFSVTQ